MAATFTFAKTGNGNISIKVTGAAVNYPERTVMTSRIKEIRLSKNATAAVVVELEDSTDYTILSATDTLVLVPDVDTPAGITYAAGSKTKDEMYAILKDSTVFQKANSGNPEGSGLTPYYTREEANDTFQPKGNYLTSVNIFVDNTLKGVGSDVDALGVDTTVIATKADVNALSSQLAGLTTITKSMFAGSLGHTNATLNATTYFLPNGQTTVSTNIALRQMIMAEAGTLKNLRIYLGSSHTGNGALTITLSKNSVNTAMQIVIPTGATGGVYSETTQSIAVAAGDRIAVQIVNASTDVAGATFDGFALMFYQ